MNTKVQAVVISFMLFNNSFLSAMKIDDINWETFGARYHASEEQDEQHKNLFFILGEEEVPELLRPFAQELFEIERRYYNGVAMNKLLDEQLMCRLHEIQTNFCQECGWYARYLLAIRENRVFGVQWARYTYSADSSVEKTPEVYAQIIGRVHEVTNLSSTFSKINNHLVKPA